MLLGKFCRFIHMVVEGNLLHTDRYRPGPYVILYQSKFQDHGYQSIPPSPSDSGQYRKCDIQLGSRVKYVVRNIHNITIWSK